MPLKKRKVADEEPAEAAASDDSAEFDDGFDSDLQGDDEDRRKCVATDTCLHRSNVVCPHSNLLMHTVCLILCLHLACPVDIRALSHGSI